jgi:hypothetical protein
MNQSTDSNTQQNDPGFILSSATFCFVVNREDGMVAKDNTLQSASSIYYQVAHVNSEAVTMLNHHL